VNGDSSICFDCAQIEQEGWEITDASQAFRTQRSLTGTGGGRS